MDEPLNELTPEWLEYEILLNQAKAIGSYFLLKVELL